MSRYILTGTPGCGKTTIIRALDEKGFHVIEEAATDVILESQALGVAEPWWSSDFIDKIIMIQQQRQLQAENRLSDVQFYDRSPVCTYALSMYLGFEPSENLVKEIKRIQDDQVYNRHVFFIENLGFTAPTEARKISHEEALKFEKIHREVYAKLSYECIFIRAATVEKRVDTILRLINDY